MLAEWHLSPDEILERWTEERLDLFWHKRNERMRRMNAALRGEEETTKPPREGQNKEQEPRRVSHREFFNGPLGHGLANPNAARFQRIQVMRVQ